MSGSDEQRLVDRDDVMAKLFRSVVNYARRRIGQDAEDVAQETLILLRDKYGHLEREGDLTRVTMKIAVYKVLEFRRDKGRRPTEPVGDLRLTDGAPNQEDATAHKEYLQTVLKALRKLKERCRKLILMKMEGLSLSEIGKRLGARTDNQLYIWNHRCRNELRQAIHRLQGIRT